MSDAVSEFDDFVVGRGPALLRLGYLLTDDRALAEDLVQEVLLKVHRRWSHTAAVERPEAYVRRVMVNEFVSCGVAERVRRLLVRSLTVPAQRPPTNWRNVT